MKLVQKLLILNFILMALTAINAGNPFSSCCKPSKKTFTKTTNTSTEKTDQLRSPGQSDRNNSNDDYEWSGYSTSDDSDNDREMSKNKSSSIPLLHLVTNITQEIHQHGQSPRYPNTHSTETSKFPSHCSLITITENSDDEESETEEYTELNTPF